jgi:hypothetical protein
MGLYSYASNNPLHFIDPRGLRTFLRGNTETGNSGMLVLDEFAEIEAANLTYGDPAVGEGVRYPVPWRAYVAAVDAYWKVNFRHEKHNCSPASLEVLLRMTGDSINGVPLTDPSMNGMYDLWIRRDGPGGAAPPRSGGVAVMEALDIGQLVFGGASTQVERRSMLRPGQFVQAYETAGGDAGHAFWIEDVRYNDQGEVESYLMISANKPKHGNAIKRQWRDIDHYEEMYVGELFDSTQ